ncbi:MAG: hypothetical protein E7230_04985 [Clostridiales bacterium]|nr:hypothetical protein [Clostridiales bacterium]
MRGVPEMRKDKTKKRKMLNKAVVCMLTVCILSCAAFLDGFAYAASEYKYASPFSKTGYDTYYHNGRFANNLIVNGVDISDWQSKNCRFGDAKAAGVDYAIMRVTWTSYGKSALSLHNDDNFYSQYKNAKANGVMTGVYVFSQAKNATEGKQEAEFAIKRLKALGIGPKDLNLPVYMDYEFAGGIFGRMHGISKTAATNAAVAFCNTIKAAGYTPGIYANTSFFSSYIVTSQLASDVDLWCAQYYSRNQSKVNYTKWQYSSSAKINGMLSYTGAQGKIDVDFWYLNKNNAVSSVVTKICGKTTLSVADAKAPKFKLYAGDKLLKEGTDYSLGYIRNNAKGSGYVYVKGIGSYGGYALIPIKITDATSGEDTDEINCANYLAKANTETSKYISTPNVTVKATKIKKIKGKKQKFYIIVQKVPKAYASGYQVKYSRNSDMSDSVIKTIGTKYNNVSKNIKTNARGRYYYVQVRTYKDSGGLRYYSSWSKVKKVWVK